MNAPIDDKAFEEYLKGGSPVSQHYQALEGDEVPSELDREVLARAEAAVRSPVTKRTRKWQRWSVPVALAASTVLAVSIVLESGQQEAALTRAPSARPASAQSEVSQAESTTPPGVAAPTEPPRAEAAPSEDRATGPAMRDREVSALSESTEPAPTEAAEEPRPAPVAPALDVAAKRADTQSESDNIANASAPSASGRLEEESTRRNVQLTAQRQRSVVNSTPIDLQRMAAPMAADSATASAEQKSAASIRDPQEWLRAIRELRAAGKAEEADREWKQFREAYPQHFVADDDPAIP